MAARRRSGFPARGARTGPGGAGRDSSRAAERVSDDLRRGAGGFLPRRRRVAALSIASSAAYAVVALYQFGIVRRVPEPAAPGLDADRVDAAGEAYRLLRTPDAALGLTSAGVTLALVGAGDGERHLRQPLIPVAAAGKVVADAALAVLLFAEQVTRHRALCSWCTVAAVCNVAAVPPALAEARAAVAELRGRGRGRPRRRTAPTVSD